MPFGKRLKSFTFGFTGAGLIAAGLLFVQVQMQGEELQGMVREAASRQAAIERRLAALEGGKK